VLHGQIFIDQRVCHFTWNVMSHFHQTSPFDYYGPLSFHIITDIIQVCAVKEQENFYR